MPQYLLAVHGSAEPTAMDAMTPEQVQGVFADVGAFNQRLQDQGSWVFAGGLMPIDLTTTVDATGADTVITDGPFSESKEWIGGFWVVEAPDLDAALALAAEGSRACRGRVEVRPFQPEPPADAATA